MFQLPEIPDGSILGLSFSGFHDSAVAIINPTGRLVFACNLERISRTKQDGRWPQILLANIPWQKIAHIAVATEEQPSHVPAPPSILHPIPLNTPPFNGPHNAEFYRYLDTLPIRPHFVCHQLAHAHSAFWGSGFDDALCLTHDGGMLNCPWFGGLYAASVSNGLTALDRFPTGAYARLANFYAFITALMGLTPNKHEGKMTGLAAYGKASPQCRELLLHWLSHKIADIENTLGWFCTHDPDRPSQLVLYKARAEKYKVQLSGFSREDIAATIQALAEEYVVLILANARQRGWTNDNICLAGGLFSNVKINQAVKEFGFKNIFIAPPMTDDGTAYGAALDILAQQNKLGKFSLDTMALGPAFDAAAVRSALEEAGLRWTTVNDPAKDIARLLADNKIVAVFAGRMEYGPRALGNRSILGSASDSAINNALNAQLNRTEFMPFAPMTRSEDAAACYENIAGAEHAAEFMTITFRCTPYLKQSCPAVVHVDGTARPQLVVKEKNPFIHAIITAYKELTGRPAIINTSFNVHEEPIVCTPQDAIAGFLDSGLDYLYFDTGQLLSFADNHEAALRHHQNKRRNRSQKEENLTNLVDELWKMMPA